jgi:hypothetical protein
MFNGMRAQQKQLEFLGHERAEEMQPETLQATRRFSRVALREVRKCES